MPPPKPKQTRGNAAKKEQIAEKVKEIQQRQKNWMRQRDEQLQSHTQAPSKQSFTNTQPHSSPGVKIIKANAPTEKPPHSADILKIHHDPPQQLAADVSDKLNVKVKHGFGAWLHSRKHTEEESHDYNTTRDDSLGPRNDNAQRHTEGEGFLPTGRSYPLSPAEFDSLADSIAAKVKKDLGIKRNSGVAHQNNENGDVSLKRGRTFVHDSEIEGRGGVGGGGGGVGGGGGDSKVVDVSSHQCPFCSSLMVNPAHIPMMLVPCGHTVCKQCSSSHPSCRLCGTRVGSLTTNIMLQQIIHDFHRKNHAAVTSSSPLHKNVETTWDRHDGSSSLPPKTTSKHRNVNYSSQLQNLQERQAALQEEAISCRQERDRITAKVKRAEKQVKAIEKEENSLQQQIQQLEAQLHSLQEHKQEYTGEYQQLQESQRAASDHLALVERTLSALGEEIDKVQFLAEGQENGFHHR